MKKGPFCISTFVNHKISRITFCLSPQSLVTNHEFILETEVPFITSRQFCGRRRQFCEGANKPSAVVWPHSHVQNVVAIPNITPKGLEHHAQTRGYSRGAADLNTMPHGGKRGCGSETTGLVENADKPRSWTEALARSSSLKAVDGHPLLLSVQIILPQPPAPLAFNAVKSILCPLTWGRVSVQLSCYLCCNHYPSMHQLAPEEKPDVWSPG